jgi:hypothetical protein
VFLFTIENSALRSAPMLATQFLIGVVAVDRFIPQPRPQEMPACTPTKVIPNSHCISRVLGVLPEGIDEPKRLAASTSILESSSSPFRSPQRCAAGRDATMTTAMLTRSMGRNGR